jgi:hypothetical protein
MALRVIWQYMDRSILSSLSLILKLFCDSDLLGEESLDRYNEPLNKPMGKGLETLTLDLGIRVGWLVVLHI